MASIVPTFPTVIELQPALLPTPSDDYFDHRERFSNHSVEPGDIVDTVEAFPEGGLRAWSVVLGSFAILCPTFGLTVSAGILQSYWAAHQLAAYTSSSIGWIISLQAFFSLVLAIQVGPLFDRYGPRMILLIGSVGYVASLVLLAQCTHYWHFLLVFGGLMGICLALLTTTAISVISHWFLLKRGLASGVAIMGTSFGGIVLPLILKVMLTRLGWTWSIRAFALLVAGMLLIGNICIRGRLRRKADPRGGVINLKCFQDKRFVWATLGISCAEFCFFGPLGLLPTYALSQGFTTQTSINIIAALNAGSAIGRFCAGHLSDKWGRFNSMLIFLTFSVFAIFCFWIPISGPRHNIPAVAYSVRSTSGASHQNVVLLYTFSILFGFGSGSIISLTPVLFGQLCTAEQYGQYYGTSYFIVSFADLICIPIGGALLPAAGPRIFAAFFGIMLMLSLVGFGMARWACLEHKWRWRAII